MSDENNNEDRLEEIDELIDRLLEMERTGVDANGAVANSAQQFSWLFKKFR